MPEHHAPDDLTTRREQLIEAMSAVSEDRTCAGWTSDWARTLHAEGGIWETLGRAVGWPTGNYDQWEWVSWDEAARLYGHQIQAVTTDPQTGLRDRIAAAIAADDGHPWDTLCADTQHHYLDNADAVLAVLPPSADRAAVLREAAEAVQHHGCPCESRLRRLAAEAQQPASREPVRHAPGKVICCPDCRAKGRTVCMDDGRQTASADTSQGA